MLKTWQRSLNLSKDREKLRRNKKTRTQLNRPRETEEILVTLLLNSRANFRLPILFLQIPSPIELPRSRLPSRLTWRSKLRSFKAKITS